MTERGTTDTFLSRPTTICKPRKEEPLESDFVEAMRRWGQLTRQPVRAAGQIAFRHAANRYCADIVSTKASRTQDENQIELEFLCEIFDKHPVVLEVIKPVHVPVRISAGAWGKRRAGARGRPDQGRGRRATAPRTRWCACIGRAIPLTADAQRTRSTKPGKRPACPRRRSDSAIEKKKTGLGFLQDPRLSLVGPPRVELGTNGL